MTAIVFDLDGTLLHTDEAYRDVLAGAIADVRGDVPERWVEAYDEAFFDLFPDCEPDPIRRAFARIDGCADPEPYARALHEREIASLSPPDHAHADLEQLAEEYTLGVLTNGQWEWQLAKLRAHGLEEYFDAVVASYEVGVHKPDPAPFRALEERLPARRYGMVGDSDADVDGATGVGWFAHRYDGDRYADLPAALFPD